MNTAATYARHPALKALVAVQRKAWNVMMNGSIEDACTVWGQEGKNSIAWEKAAAAERAYRVEHDLLI